MNECMNKITVRNKMHLSFDMSINGCLKCIVFLYSICSSDFRLYYDLFLVIKIDFCVIRSIHFEIFDRGDESNRVHSFIKMTDFELVKRITCSESEFFTSLFHRILLHDFSFALSIMRLSSRINCLNVILTSFGRKILIALVNSNSLMQFEFTVFLSFSFSLFHASEQDDIERLIVSFVKRMNGMLQF